MHERPYERLIVWKEAYALCLHVYRLTAAYPSYERFGLADQMRRASSSVPLNIVEGNVKRTNRDKVRYFDIAAGSLEELSCAARLSHDLKYLPDQEYDVLCRRIHRVSYLLTKFRGAFS